MTNGPPAKYRASSRQRFRKIGMIFSGIPAYESRASKNASQYGRDRRNDEQGDLAPPAFSVAQGPTPQPALRGPRAPPPGIPESSGARNPQRPAAFAGHGQHARLVPHPFQESESVTGPGPNWEPRSPGPWPLRRPGRPTARPFGPAPGASTTPHGPAQLGPLPHRQASGRFPAPPRTNLAANTPAAPARVGVQFGGAQLPGGFRTSVKDNAQDRQQQRVGTQLADVAGLISRTTRDFQEFLAIGLGSCLGPPPGAEQLPVGGPKTVPHEPLDLLVIQRPDVELDKLRPQRHTLGEITLEAAGHQEPVIRPSLHRLADPAGDLSSAVSPDR